MRRLLLTLVSGAMFVAPLAAHAAFETPGQLITAIQTQSARSFSLTAHGSSDGTYVSVWANGASEGTDASSAEIKVAATVDVASGDFKLRAKGDVLMTDGIGYVKLKSLNGSMTNEFASLSGAFSQKQWLTLPLSDDLMNTSGLLMDIGNMNAEQADTMYSMQHTVSKGVNVYTLHLTPDSAVDLALQIRNFIGDDQPVSNDFFPWRELAEGMHYELVIRTDMNDHFLGSTLTTSMANASAGFNATVTETAMKGGLTVDPPKDVMTVDQLMMFGSPASAYFMGAPMETEWEPAVLPADDSRDWMLEEPSMTDEPAMTSTETPVDFECLSSDMTPMKLLTLQRAGICPVTKPTTRASEYRAR